MKELIDDNRGDGALPAARATAAEPVVSALRDGIANALYTHHHYGWKRHDETDCSEASLLSALIQTHGFLAEYEGKYRVEIKPTPAFSFDGVVSVYWDADEPKSFAFGAPRHRGDLWFRAFEYNVAPATACRYCGGTGADHYISGFHCWACDGTAVQVRQSTPRGFKHKPRLPAQGMETRQGGDGTAPSQDDSPVGATDAPETGPTHPHGGHNEGTH